MIDMKSRLAPQYFHALFRQRRTLSHTLLKGNFNKDFLIVFNDQQQSNLTLTKRYNATLALENNVEFRQIPTLPFVGSTISSYSGMPDRHLDWSNDRVWQLEMRKKYGDFHSYGFPGLGHGLNGIIYSVSDPREFLKVIRHEGTYPSGLIQSLWPLKKVATELNLPLFRGPDGGYYGRSSAWKIPRLFLQSDLLSPQAATSYIPGVICAAELASKGAPSSADNLNHYLNICSFDMFYSIMFGELSAVADPNTTASPENVKFIEAAATLLDYDADLVLSPYETFAGRVLNVKTNRYKLFEEAFHIVNDIATKKVQVFKEKYVSGELNEMQKNSYLANLLKRHDEGKGTKDYNMITDDMIIDICTSLLFASVDTTSGILAWALVHLASNPIQQDILYHEIQENMVSQDSGRLTADMLDKRSKVPFLNAFLRESHRVTPTLTNSILKQIESDIYIHDTLVPAESKLFFNNYAIQMDPAYIDSPEEFRPERWLPDAVAKRKGTPLELMDHPFFKDPFSQGARKCPGSRVSMNEVLCLLSQFILDYEIRPPSEYVSYSDYSYKIKGVLTPDLPKLEFVSRKS